MPRMNGEACFRELRRRAPGLPILIASGYNEQETRERFIGRSVSAFIQKPFRSRELAACIESILDEDQEKDDKGTRPE